MTDYSVNIELNIQQANDRIKELERRLDGLGDSAQQAGRQASGSFNGAADGLRQIENQADRTGKKFLDFGEIATGALRRIGEIGVQSAISALQGLGAVALDSVRVFADYEAAMNNVAAITGDTGKGFDQLKEKARELGATTRYSASEAAEAMTYLASSGQETGQILATTSEVLNLAAAGAISLGQSADIVVNTMGQFGIAATEANRVVDVLAATASASAVGVMEVGEAMKYLGPTAQSLGMSLEEAAAIIGVLGNNGLKGGEATSALSTALVKLAAPTNEAIAAMEKLNFQAFDGSGKFVGMQDVIEQLNKSMANYTDEQKAAAIGTIFGNEAYQEMSILLKEGADGFAKMTAAVTDTDKAAEMARIQNQGLANTWAELQSAMEEAQIVLAESLSPAIVAAGDFIAALINELSGGAKGSDAMSSAAENLAAKIKEIDVKSLAADIKVIVGGIANFVGGVAKLIEMLMKLHGAINSVTQLPGLKQLTGLMGMQYNPLGAVAGVISGFGGSLGKVPAFAAGGVVSSPTMALIGEAGAEAVVPLSGGRSIPVQFSGGGGNSGESEKTARLIGREVGVQVAQAMQPFYRQGNIGPTSTGAHFDIKRSDRGYFDRTALDKYVSINGSKPLSAGTTVAGGQFGAKRSYGSHNGWDFAFSGQADLSLKNGAQWVGNTKTQHGDKASFMTPDGKVYEILHGTFHGQAKPVAAMGGGSTAQPSKAAEIAIALKESLGLTDAQAAGIVGNFLREAGKDLNPRINEGGKVGLPMGRGGYGLAQWTGSRQDDLVKFAGSKEKAGDLKTQIAFTIHELMGSEKNALNKLKQTNTPEDAAAAFEKYYERAGVVALGERKANARGVYNELQGQGSMFGSSFSGVDEAARAAEELAKQRERAVESLQSEIDKLKESNQTSGDRLTLLRAETEMYKSAGVVQDDAIKLMESEIEATNQLSEFKAKLEEQTQAGLVSTEKAKELETQFNSTLAETIELKKQEIAAENELKKARENYESLQRYNEEYERGNQAIQERIAAISSATTQTEQQLYQSQLTGFGTQETQDALAAVAAFNEGQNFLQEQMARLNEEYDKGLMTMDAYKQKQAEIAEASQLLTDKIMGQNAAQQQLDAATQKAAEVQGFYKSIVDNATSGFTNFTMNVLSGTESIGQATGKLFQSILSNLANKALSSFFGSLFGGFGGGGGGGFKLFANGGIIDRPTNAIMGEAGPEAVVPLPDGKSIPVIMQGGGGGSTNITVNVNNPSGGEDGRRLGKQISEAIKAQLVNERRVGGLLR